MLVPLTREKFEQIIPLIATGPQYAHYWGNFQNILKQLLVSFVAVIIALLVGLILGDAGNAIALIFALVGGLYWLWSPIYRASMRNAAYRRYAYSGFLRGRVVDVYITEELIGEEESVNKQGELVIIENREKRINVEVADETGFLATVQTPLRRIHKGIKPGQIAELLVLSNQPDLEEIAQITDVYIPRNNLWIGEYPYLQRDIFAEVSRQLSSARESSPPRRESKTYRRSR